MRAPLARHADCAAHDGSRWPVKRTLKAFYDLADYFPFGAVGVAIPFTYHFIYFAAAKSY